MDKSKFLTSAAPVARAVTFTDGSVETLYFKQLNAGQVRRWRMDEQSGDPATIMYAMQKLVAQSLCDENGKLALEKFSAAPAYYYDAILMDIRMPVMDGHAATKAIRGLYKDDARSVPIIAMTADAFDGDVKASLNSGMNAHLNKPISPEKLYETLAKFMH